MTAYVCAICKFPITGGTMTGAGDGTGQKFACPMCYWRARTKTAEKKATELDAGLADATKTQIETAEAVIRLYREHIESTDRAANAEAQLKTMTELAEEATADVTRLMEELDERTQQRDAYKILSHADESLELERQLQALKSEINCRIEHGAESGGHLEALRALYP